MKAKKHSVLVVTKKFVVTTGGYKDESGVHHLNVLDFQRDIRTCPKPVVAMVAGYAIGGGHVLHMLCDLTIAAENAIVVKRVLK